MKVLARIIALQIILMACSSNLYTNLIINGNFSQGNTGFTSDYLFAETSTFGQGKYAITDNPQKYHPGFYKCSDHTQDSAKLMMIIDSYSSSNKVIWRQTVNVRENTIYEFRMWATKLVYYEDSYLEIRINGKALDSIYHVTHSSGTWSTFHRKWYSQNYTSAIIEIINLTTASGGNDLAFDDIYFNEFAPCNDIEIEQADDVIVCKNSPIQIGNYSNKDYSYNWFPTQYLSESNVSNPICTPQTPITYYVRVTSPNYCVYYDTIVVNLKESKPLKILTNSNYLCRGDSIKLISNNQYEYFQWSNGSTNKEIYVFDAGKYSLKVIDTNGCEQISYIDIYLFDTENSILGPDAVCQNEQYTLSVKNEAMQYNWYNGEKSKSINCKGPGTFIVECIYEHGCKSYDTITIYEKGQYVNVCKLSYDLGALCPYSTIQFDIKIVSRTPSQSVISQIQFSNKNGIFTFEDNKPLPIIINNGDNLYKVNMFALEQSGFHSDTLYITINEECETTFQVVLNWNVVDSDTKVWLQDTLVSAGDFICYPIYFESSCKSDQDIFKTYTLVLDFNKKLFMPEKVDFGNFDISIIDDEISRITVTASHNLKNQYGIINHLCGHILLSDSIDNKVTINSFKFDNYDISTNIIKNGNIKLSQCQFGIRHIDFIKTTNFSINPNISDDYSKINLVSSEIGTFKFEVFDYAGNLVDTFYLKRNSKSDTEELDYDLRLDNKTQGVYFIKLTSPWSTLTKSLVIIR